MTSVQRGDGLTRGTLARWPAKVRAARDGTTEKKPNVRGFLDDDDRTRRWITREEEEGRTNC